MTMSRVRWSRARWGARSPKTPGSPSGCVPALPRAAGTPLMRRVVKIAGVIESQTDEALQPLYREWERGTPRVDATILAALGQIELHLSTQAPSADDAVAAIDLAVR